jgi:RHS repeat-associated protein
LKSASDAKGQVALYSYFADNSLQQLSYSNAVVSTPSVSYTYDTNYSRLLTMTDGIGTTTYTYHTVTNGQLGAGQVATVDGPLTNDTVTYTYDELGRVVHRDIDGVGQEWTLDELGRVTVVTNALGSFTNEYVGETELIATNYYPNGQKTIFSYYGSTNDHRLESIWHQNSSAATISKFEYTYDAQGQIDTWTQQADSGTPEVSVLEYDPVDQLLGVTVRSNSVAGAILKRYVYGYDSAGNRTSEQIYTEGSSPSSSVAQATHNQLNQLTTLSGGGPVRFAGDLDELGTVKVAGVDAIVDSLTTNFVGFASTSTGTNTISVVATDYSDNSRTNEYELVVTNNGVAETLSYDPNGNLTNSVTATTTNSYEWDAEDRLVKITQVDGTGTRDSDFSYDGLSRLVKILETTNGVPESTNWFVWCGVERCEERDSSGGTVTKRFFGHGEETSGTPYYYTGDHLGSVRELVDASEAVKARYEYDPYGRRTKVSGTAEASFGFTGHFYHETSRFHFAPFRAYDASQGRWLNRDPIKEDGGVNLYAYVGGNPVNAFDPLGLFLKSTDTPSGAKAMAWALTSGAGVSGGLSIAEQKIRCPDSPIDWGEVRKAVAIDAGLTILTLGTIKVYKVYKATKLARAAKSAPGSTPKLLGPGTSFGPKIRAWLAKRGWTERLVQSTIDKPVRTVPWRDTRHLRGGKRMNDPATAYYSERGGYVVRNNRTGDIVQVSDRTDPDWIAPWD